MNRQEPDLSGRMPAREPEPAISQQTELAPATGLPCFSVPKHSNDMQLPPSSGRFLSRQATIRSKVDVGTILQEHRHDFLVPVLRSKPDSAGSRSEHASGAEGGRQNRRFEPSVGQALDRSRCPPRAERRTPKAPELNPAVAISSIRQSLSTSSAGTACLAFEDVRQQLPDLALEIHALRETSGGRRRRPELNPGGATVRRSGGNDLQKRENPEIGSPVCVVCL